MPGKSFSQQKYSVEDRTCGNIQYAKGEYEESLTSFSIQYSVISNQWSVFSGQYSVVSGQYSVVSGQ